MTTSINNQADRLFGAYDDEGQWITNAPEHELPALGSSVNGRIVAYIGDPRSMDEKDTATATATAAPSICERCSRTHNHAGKRFCYGNHCGLHPEDRIDSLHAAIREALFHIRAQDTTSAERVLKNALNA